MTCRCRLTGAGPQKSKLRFLTLDRGHRLGAVVHADRRPGQPKRRQASRLLAAGGPETIQFGRHPGHGAWGPARAGGALRRSPAYRRHLRHIDRGAGRVGVRMRPKVSLGAGEGATGEGRSAHPGGLGRGTGYQRGTKLQPVSLTSGAEDPSPGRWGLYRAQLDDRSRLNPPTARGAGPPIDGRRLSRASWSPVTGPDGEAQRPTRGSGRDTSAFEGKLAGAQAGFISGV